MLTLSEKSRLKIGIGLLALIIVRLITMLIIPLTDTTEARYAEIARKMLETGNWITLLNSYTTPFWGKPPLSTWCGAISMQLFGINAFAARLPSLLIGLATAMCLYYWVRSLRGASQALITVTVLLTSLLMVISMGAVMTDPFMLFTTTLAMICFWQAITTKRLLFGYGFFAALGVGLLAKGLAAFILSVLPIGLWVLYRRKLRETFSLLPCITGTLLMLAIALPWYLLAEKRTPGFLQYFFIGEHFSRFLESGWQGDRYGHAHQKPLGTIWVYWLIGFFPWSLFVILSLIKRKFRVRELLEDKEGLMAYLLLWILVPLVFFTFSKNIILTYTFTGLPAFACLFVEAWQRSGFNTSHFLLKEKVIFGGLLPLLIGALVYVSVSYNSIPGINRRSQKLLAEYYLKERPTSSSQLVYYLRQYYSAEFYTAGKAVRIASPNELNALLENQSIDYVAVPIGKYALIAKEIETHFHYCDKFGNILLYKENA